MDSILRPSGNGPANFGLYREALHEVYIPRIQRGDASFAANILGARSALLSVLVHFFERGRWGSLAQTTVAGQSLTAEDPHRDYTVPEILEPAQFKRLLETAEEEVPELIPFLAMAGFAGVRRSELALVCFILAGAFSVGRKIWRA